MIGIADDAAFFKSMENTEERSVSQNIDRLCDVREQMGFGQYWLADAE